MIFTDKETAKKRMKTCIECPHSRGYFKLFWIVWSKKNTQCTLCTCNMDLKTTFKRSKCRIGKW